MTDPLHPHFEHPENIEIGLARVIYGPRNVGWSTTNGWHMPGGRFTTNRDEAVAVATEMNRLMGGVQVAREPMVSQDQVDWAVGVITRNWPINQTQGG